MGARAQVKIEDRDEEIYLYTHWGSSELPKDVAKALDRGRDRWDDFEYLNRIIFDAMKEDDVTSTTGYGIGTKPHGDLDYEPIEVDCARGLVTHNSNTYSFEEFIAEYGE